MKNLDTHSLRILWEETRSEAAEARIGLAFAGNYGSETEQRFRADLERWEARRAEIEAELDRRGQDYE